MSVIAPDPTDASFSYQIEMLLTGLALNNIQILCEVSASKN
jgi:hypothetical protein